MLYVVGLGLSDEKDITVKGLEAVKGAARVYLESYTSILMVPKDRLEAFYGRPVITATRELVELSSDEILDGAGEVDVAFLVVGDPLGATTHTDLILRADQLHIPVQVIHNASILTALGSTGLQMYSFGQTLSLPFYTDTWTPESWYDRLEENLAVGMHTLVLVDIKVREQSEENMARGRLIYEPPRFMSPYTAFQQILLTESKRHPTLPPAPTTPHSSSTPASTSTTTNAATTNADIDIDNNNNADIADDNDDVDTTGKPPSRPSMLPPDQTLAMSLSRIGTPTQRIISGTLAELAALGEDEFGPPLHSVVVVGKRLHPLELEYAGRFCIGGEGGGWWKVGREVYGVERESH